MYSRDRLEKTNFSESKRRGESLGRGPANMRPAAWHNLSPRMRVCPLAGPRPRQVASGPALAADAGCAALHCPAGASAAGASALLVLGASAWWDCGPVNHKSSRLLPPPPPPSKPPTCHTYENNKFHAHVHVPTRPRSRCAHPALFRNLFCSRPGIPQGEGPSAARSRVVSTAPARPAAQTRRASLFPSLPPARPSNAGRGSSPPPSSFRTCPMSPRSASSQRPRGVASLPWETPGSLMRGSRPAQRRGSESASDGIPATARARPGRRVQQQIRRRLCPDLLPALERPLPQQLSGVASQPWVCSISACQPFYLPLQ